MRVWEGALIVVWALFAIGVLVWACHWDAPKLLQHYDEIGGDELQELPLLDPLPPLD